MHFLIVDESDQSQQSLVTSIDHLTRCNRSCFVICPLNWNLFDDRSLYQFPLSLTEIQSKKILLLICKESKTLQASHFPFLVHRWKLWSPRLPMLTGICLQAFQAKPQLSSYFLHHNCETRLWWNSSKTFHQKHLEKFGTCADVATRTFKDNREKFVETKYNDVVCCPIKLMGSKKCWIEVCFVFEHLPWLTTFQNNDEGIDVTKQVDDLDDFLGDPHIVTRIILRTKTWSVNHNYSSIGVSSPNSLSKSTIWWIIYLYLLQTKIFAESAFSDWWTHRLCNGVWLSPECRRQGASFGLIAHVKICFVFSWRVEDKVEKSWLAFPRLSYGSDHQLVIRLWWKLHHSASLGHLLQRFLLTQFLFTD